MGSVGTQLDLTYTCRVKDLTTYDVWQLAKTNTAQATEVYACVLVVTD